MRTATRDPGRIWRRLGWLVLVLGLGGAAVLYGRAQGPADEASGYEIIDGVAYPRRLEDTKGYARQMEAYGGKGLVLADKATRFLASLGHGRRLAVVLATGSLVAAGLLLHAGRRRSGAVSETDRPDEGPGADRP